MNKIAKNQINNKISYLGSYPPRECGIATFTKDLVRYIKKLDYFKSPIIVAMNQGDETYNYDRLVKCQIRRDFLQDYILAVRCENLVKLD